MKRAMCMLAVVSCFVTVAAAGPEQSIIEALRKENAALRLEIANLRLEQDRLWRELESCRAANGGADAIDRNANPPAAASRLRTVEIVVTGVAAPDRTREQDEIRRLEFEITELTDAIAAAQSRLDEMRRENNERGYRIDFSEDDGWEHTRRDKPHSDASLGAAAEEIRILNGRRIVAQNRRLELERIIRQPGVLLKGVDESGMMFHTEFVGLEAARAQAFLPGDAAIIRGQVKSATEQLVEMIGESVRTK